MLFQKLNTTNIAARATLDVSNVVDMRSTCVLNVYWEINKKANLEKSKRGQFVVWNRTRYFQDRCPGYKNKIKQVVLEWFPGLGPGSSRHLETSLLEKRDRTCELLAVFLLASGARPVGRKKRPQIKVSSEVDNSCFPSQTL